ncbi:MAG: DnaJ domain-containing protein [Betaproteobacteria bacterium AqS2]|uniref:DnaJ domain-containing protein n=1 Tax=Candidatus Amphirhobacter heronislandensis TaxID=1732024 RepID=A0A930Y2A8_9GAMM|nr:DnaJ domain-containing protein [Betaproteobacteria bacterium AqS2]
MDLGEEEVKALFEALEGLRDNEYDGDKLPLLKKGQSPRELALRVLGLEKDATEEQIDKAFQKKRMAAHPDREPDPEKKKAAEAKLKEIQAAYMTLTGKRSPGRKR